MVDKITKVPDATSVAQTHRDIEDRRPLRQWHTPRMTRIDLKETLFFRGSNLDGFGGSTPG